MNNDILTNSTQKPHLPLLKRRDDANLNKALRRMLHRRALEFHQRLRQVRAKLHNNRQRLVFDYIFDNTIGFNKLSDPIALSQFEQGKRNRETGEIIDNGCGLSHNPIRQARKELIRLGLIIEKEVIDASGARQANRYTIRFVAEMVEAEISHKKSKPVKQHTPTPYQQQVATIKLPTEVKKQRCIKSRESEKSHYLHRDHVDYLVDEIEKVTGDTHSRGGFAQIALTVAEGTIMELLHKLKDRGNIQNKGAWFIASASRYAKRKVIKADALPAEKTDMNMGSLLHNPRSKLHAKLSMQSVFAEKKPLPIYEQKRLLNQMRLDE